MTLLSQALRYAAHGWPVFPTHSPTAAGCSCGRTACSSPAKHPRTPNGLSAATTDATTVREWWGQQWPDANIGVRTGREAGCIVLDVDGDDGLESLRSLERENDELPRTLSVVTPSGGAHIYFRHPGHAVRNSVRKLGAGIDVRGDGGYVLAPPSVGTTGRRYELDERAPLAAAPAWLLTLILEEQTARPAAPTSEWLRIVRGVDSGSRNNDLARLAGHLLRRYVDVDLAAELLHLVNSRCRPPLDASEVDRIIDSIAEREARRRTGTCA